MALFSPRVFTNDLTRQYLDSRASWAERVDAVLLHSEYVNTLRAAPRSLQEYLTEHPTALRQLFHHALAGTDSRLSALATRALAQPKSNFYAAIVNAPAFGEGLREFTNSAGTRNPVYVGHFGAILLCSLRAEYELVSAAVGGMGCFVKTVFETIGLLGRQEFLWYLLQEQPTRWTGTDGSPAAGFATLAAMVADAAERREWPTVVGFLNVLLNSLKDEILQPNDGISSLELVSALTDATFADPKEELVFYTGIDVITRIVAWMENPQDPVAQAEWAPELPGVKGFLAAYGEGFLRRFDTPEEGAWEAEQLGEQQMILVRAFPVLWEAMIERLYPVFFRNPPVSSDFNSAFLERVCKMERPRVLWFAPRLIRQFLRKPMVVPGSRLAQQRDGQVVAANPHLVKLAQWLAEQPHAPASECTKADSEWVRFTEVVVDGVLPYLERVPAPPRLDGRGGR
jgi:hypothetical protein